VVNGTICADEYLVGNGVDGITGGTAELLWRNNGAAADYQVSIGPINLGNDQGELNIASDTSTGVFHYLAPTSIPTSNNSWFQYNTWYHVCMTVNGYTITGTVWAETMTPSGPVIGAQLDTLTATDVNQTFGTGYAGLQSSHGPSRTYFDNIALTSSPINYLNTTVTDTLPVGLTYVSCSGAGGLCGDTAGVVNWNTGEVDQGASESVTLVAKISGCPLTIPNQASWNIDVPQADVLSNIVSLTSSCDSPTPTNTSTNTATNTHTFTDTPTNTFTNTCTNTVTPTNTGTYTNTATNTVTKTMTDTATSTSTNSATNTSTHTITNTATNTFTSTLTNTATNSFTATVTNTITNTATNTATETNTLLNTATNTATVSATNTATNTYTATLTFTPSNTDTATFTDTASFTPTPTDTWVDTPTSTNTFTSTDTNTVTNTFTNTYTVTNTDTPTNTNTVTNTFTVTETDTDTPSDTPTTLNTATNTFTGTLTNTPTASFTTTPTATETFTNTASFTDTSTFSVTPTNTLADTATNTMTNTFTHTATSTATATPTSTPMPSLTMAKNVSESTARAGDVLTYSIGITVTGNSQSGVVVTDVLPSGLTFRGFGNVPAGTVTIANPPTLRWALPSPLVVGTYQLTYQAQVNNFVAGGTVTNNAQLTYPGLAAPLTSSVNVQVLGLYTVSVNIYNSAGEVVKTISVKDYSQPINSISLQSSNRITTLQGPGSTILIYFAGNLIGTWDGSNNQGNPVTNGNYEIKVDSVSSTGLETSVEQQAVVDRQLSNITAYIYNSAGEVIRTLYNVVDGSIGTQMTNVSLSTSVISPGPTTSGNTTYLQIFVITSGTPVTLTWDGTNNQGTNVTPGTYSIQLHWDDGQGETTNITRNVLVTGGGGVSGVVVAEPNVLSPNRTMTTTFNAAGIAGAANLTVKIYTIAGELVTAISGTSGTASWNASGLASGVYIAASEARDINGGILCRQTTKILILH
jgi:hypothetical protein